MTGIIRRSFFAASAFGIALFATPSQAKPPHVTLVKTFPGKDSTVVAPKSIRLWFDEKPVLKASKISMTGPGGTVVKMGKVTLAAAAGSPLIASVIDTLAPGLYKVTWVTAASDGHAANGTFNFTVKAATAIIPTGTPARGTTTTGRRSGGGGL